MKIIYATLGGLLIGPFVRYYVTYWLASSIAAATAWGKVEQGLVDSL